MTEAKAVGAEYSFVEVACPICGTAGGTPLVPSAKRDEVGQTFFVDARIMLTLCENCGTVYENPQIKLEGLTPYAEKNYYTEANTAWGHDNVQHSWTFYNWHALKDALPWADFRRVMDVGAAGAWSNAMLERAPGIVESVLVEPSPRGIFNCEIRYPRVRAELGIFEEYDDTPGRFDLITFNNSFYSVSDPRSALRKVNRLLRPRGYLVLCFSYVGMNLEFWDHRNPFVHMSHVVRGVPLIYYSSNTYRKLVGLSGFRIVDDIVFELPDWDKFHQAGRQLDFVVAQAVGEPVADVDPVSLRDPEEVEAGRRFYTRYCELATERSVAHFLARRKSARLVVLHDGDDFYGAWVAGKLRAAGAEAVLMDGASVAVDDLPELVGDRADSAILLAGDWDEAGPRVAAIFRQAWVINCSPPEGYKGYGNWLRRTDGKVIVTRSFCPSRSLGDPVFPFEKRPSMNRRDISREALGFVERPEFFLPRSVDQIPFFAGAAAKFALSLGMDDRRNYLKPFQETASRGMAAGSILEMSGFALPAKPAIPSLDDLAVAVHVSAIRPVIQWAVLLGPTTFLNAAVQQLNENLSAS